MDIESNMVLPEESKELLIGHDHFYVIDMIAPRHLLGRGVYITRRTMYRNKSGYTSGADMPLAVAGPQSLSQNPSASSGTAAASASSGAATASDDPMTATASGDPNNRSEAIGFGGALVAVPSGRCATGAERSLKRH